MIIGKEDQQGKSSLARKFTALAELTKLESFLQAAIESSKVPPSETRKLLKSNSTQQVKNTALYQFMQNLFEEIGLGRLEVVKKRTFQMEFVVEKNPVSNLYTDAKGKRTCFIISDALSDFFVQDLNIPAEAEELECKNAGDKACRFKVELQPLAVYRIALDKTDENIIEFIKKEGTIDGLIDELDLVQQEMDYRLDVLKTYHILKEDHTLTKIGQTYYKYGKSVIDDELDEFEPPWKTMSEISSSISDSSSFAEALSRGMGNDIEEEDVDESDVVNLAKEAEKSTSFAQLVSKSLQKKEDENDG